LRFRVLGSQGLGTIPNLACDGRPSCARPARKPAPRARARARARQVVEGGSFQECKAAALKALNKDKCKGLPKARWAGGWGRGWGRHGQSALSARPAARPRPRARPTGHRPRRPLPFNTPSPRKNQDECSFDGVWHIKPAKMGRFYYVSSFFWDRAADAGIITRPDAIEWRTTPQARPAAGAAMGRGAGAAGGRGRGRGGRRGAGRDARRAGAALGGGEGLFCGKHRARAQVGPRTNLTHSRTVPNHASHHHRSPPSPQRRSLPTARPRCAARTRSR
jgi:hypothetical protein